MSGSIDTEFFRAVTSYQRGQLPEAERICGSILRADPHHFEARHLLGVILIARGDASRAERELAQAITGLPRSGAAHRNHGVALARLNRMEEALARFDQALALKPDDVEALASRGHALLSLKRASEALPSYDRALGLKSDLALVWHHRGAALMILGQAQDAIDSFDRAISCKRDYAEAFRDRGIALYELKRLEASAESYDAAIALKPDFADAYCDRGVVRHDLDRINEALADLDRAIALKPDFALAFANRGNALQALKRPVDALASYDRAIALDPKMGEAYFHRGMCKLSLGDFAGGWSDYEAGRTTKKYASPRPSLDAPDWSGEDLSGRSILVFAEQGYGDVFQLCRYLPLLAARGANVTLLVQDKIVRVLAGLAGICFRSQLDPAERFDFQLPLMSLPHRFGTNLSNIPSGSQPYLVAEPERAAAWQAKIGNHGFKIGVCWQGGLWQGGPALRGRSFAPKEFHPLSQVRDVRLISLQKEPRKDELEAMPDGMVIETLGGDFDAGRDAFVDTAAVMQSLDLVVSCDTSIAHLAGALGRPTWVALKYAADWRWMIDRPDSPWYPTLRLFRQTAPNDWSGVFGRMARELTSI